MAANSAQLTGNILITGGTGFLGRGILVRAARENWDAQFTIYSRDEQRQAEVKHRFPNARFILGDVRDLDRLQTAMIGHNTVIHTAAIKFIPEAEFNVSECIDVNIHGSRNVFTAARNSGVGRVIAISTDKACVPVNTYGMTKALMERLVGEFSHTTPIGHTTYVACRYGNVIGSTGSVIPVFQRQLKETGEVTITDPMMTRYFISIDEAIDIILKAALVNTGSVVIPLPKAMQLSELLVALNVIKTKTIGKRPGEKMHESLLDATESNRAFSHGSFYELMRVGEKGSLPPFYLSSEQAASITAYDMQDYIEDAKVI